MDVYLAVWVDVNASCCQLAPGWHPSWFNGAPCVATHAEKHWTFRDYSRRSMLQRLCVDIWSESDL